MLSTILNNLVLKPIAMSIVLLSSDINASNNERVLMAYNIAKNKISFISPEEFEPMVQNETLKEDIKIENNPKENSEKIFRKFMVFKENSKKILGYLVDKSDKLISKKFAIALALTLGTGYYGVHKAIPHIIDNFTQKAVEVTANGALQIGSNVSTGLIKAVLDNKVDVAKIAGTTLAYKTAEKVIENSAENIVPYIGKALKYSGTGALAILAFIMKYNVPSLIIM